MLSTAQRIALRFALTIAGIVLFLGVVINLLFFRSWRQKEQQHGDMSRMPPNMQFTWPEAFIEFQRSQRRFARRYADAFGPRNILILPAGSEEIDELYEHTFVSNLVHISDEWYLYWLTSSGTQVIVVDVSSVVENQIELFRITLLVIVVMAFFWYAVAIIVVKHSLRDLHMLAEHIQSIDVDSLDKKWTFDHLPAHDEIQIVSTAFQSMAQKLHTQVWAIKQFVANVSHEFKTPLMVLQTAIDLGEKTKNYETMTTQLRQQVVHIQRLLDTLMLLTRLESKEQLTISSVHLRSMIEWVLGGVRQQYPSIVLQLSWDDIVVQSDEWLLERVFANLLDNAGKFSPDGGVVSINISHDSIRIQDQGQGIPDDQKDNIWDPFWQWDAARWTSWFGLGLSLVKTLIDLLQWSITLESAPNQWTTVILHIHTVV